MKRPYSDMITTLSELPPIGLNDHSAFKSSLTGLYKLRINKVVDISKPVDKPIEDIDEPEDNDEAWENKLNKSNARMIQLDLQDSRGSVIKALEMERIEQLSIVKVNSIITIEGPVDVRCRNIMLLNKHVKNIENPLTGEQNQESSVKITPKEELTMVNPHPPRDQPVQTSNTINPQREELIHVANTTNMPLEEPNLTKVEPSQQVPVVQIEDDWSDMDDDDCIILN